MVIHFCSWKKVARDLAREIKSEAFEMVQEVISTYHLVLLVTFYHPLCSFGTFTTTSSLSLVLPPPWWRSWHFPPDNKVFDTGAFGCQVMIMIGSCWWRQPQRLIHVLNDDSITQGPFILQYGGRNVDDVWKQPPPVSQDHLLPLVGRGHSLTRTQRQEKWYHLLVDGPVGSISYSNSIGRCSAPECSLSKPV